MDECEPRLGEQLIRIPELPAHVDAAASLSIDERSNRK